MFLHLDSCLRVGNGENVQNKGEYTLNDTVFSFVLGNFGFGLQCETDFVETV